MKLLEQKQEPVVLESGAAYDAGLLNSVTEFKRRHHPNGKSSGVTFWNYNKRDQSPVGPFSSCSGSFKATTLWQKMSGSMNTEYVYGELLIGNTVWNARLLLTRRSGHLTDRGSYRVSVYLL